MAEYVIPNAHKNGTYVVLSIAGTETQYDAAFETICASDSLIDTFVNNIIGLINTYGFDGVDIDWEIPSNGLLFTKLMTKLYAAVKENNENHLVTAAIGGGSWQPQYYDLTNSSKYLDYINLMTYNMSTASGYHHTALYPSNSYDNPTNKAGSTLTSCSISESVAIYNNYGVSNSKIIIGSGFYGIVQTRKSTTAAWEYSTNPSYSIIKNDYLNNSSFVSYYDETCQAPYLISNDGLTFVSYDNVRSINAKCEYVIDNNLAGIFAWHCGLDGGELLNSFKDGLSK